MLSDVSVSHQIELVLRDFLLRTTGLPACSLSHWSDLTSVGSRSSYVALFAQPTERFSGPQGHQ
jgi:hypothetical protein